MTSRARWLRTFYSLSASERWVLAQAALLLVLVRIGLSLLPFRVVRRLLGFAAVRTRPSWENAGLLVDEVVRAVEMAGRHVPAVCSTCLTQALVAQLLLSRRGLEALLRIGVVKTEHGKIEAHAWVESGGRVVIGGHELERYNTLATLGQS